MSTLESMAQRLVQPVSRQEGSFAMDNLAAVAAELDRIWEMGIDYMPYRFFPTLARGDDLTLAAANFGVERKTPTKASAELVIAGEPGAVVDEEIRAAAGELIFAVMGSYTIGAEGSVTVSAQAMTAGSQGNVAAGRINEFVTSYAGLDTVTNPQAAQGGADEETDEDLLLRVKARWQTPSTGGNQGDYARWALTVPGVSRVKVFNPSAGCVEVFLVAAGNQEAGQELRETVHDAIEAVRPVGAQVTVLSGTAVVIPVSAQIQLRSGYELAEVRERIRLALEDYMQSLSFSASLVSFVRIADLLFVDGVEDVSGYTVAHGSQSIPLDETEFPQLGEVTVTSA